MIQLFIRFKKVYYINKAMVAWAKADSLVTTLLPIGAALHEEIRSPTVSQKQVDEILQRLDPINTRLTILEDEFSYTLGEGSRWLEKLVLQLLFAIALTVELTGLILAIIVSRNIQKGLKEILASSRAVTIGDFTKKAKIFSKDEIGVLANNFNNMAAALEQATIGLERKVQQRTQELQSKNRELEQFAYVASHDLQEPLRTTTGFVHLFRKQYHGKIDDAADKYLDYIVQSSERMKLLIKDLLDYSKLGQEKKLQLTDCNKIMEEVLADLQKIIHETNTEIHTEATACFTGIPHRVQTFVAKLNYQCHQVQKTWRNSFDPYQGR
jgi:signal transduction histidine kinase